MAAIVGPMAHYLVRAEPVREALPDLREELEEGEVEGLSPFGPELDRCLREARWDPHAEEAVWEEEDHCSPPLRMEREAVLDRFFEDIRVEGVDAGDGWGRIDGLPSLWGALGLDRPG